MNKVILAIALAASAAAIVPAQAEPRAASSIKVGNQCFKSTDSARGYGYWTSCDKVYSFELARISLLRSQPPLTPLNREVLGEIERGGGTEGGGGGEGSGGGGGGGR